MFFKAQNLVPRDYSKHILFSNRSDSLSSALLHPKRPVFSECRFQGSVFDSQAPLKIFEFWVHTVDVPRAKWERLSITGAAGYTGKRMGRGYCRIDAHMLVLGIKATPEATREGWNQIRS